MAIVLREISKGFDEHVVVSNVSLTVDDGELFVLLGSSGSGKSTVLRIIAGLLPPDQGTVELHGKEVTHLPPQERGTGFVFQNYAIFKHMTVADNVEFGLRIRGVPRKERRRRSEELLELVGLGGLGARMPNQLSGGQRQRVALARALAYQPAVLLLDEPFGALDVKIRAQLRRSLKEIQRQLKVTSILVTHDQEEAFELADRIGVIDRGKLIETGSPEALYHRPKTEFVATFLGGGNVLVGRADRGSIKLGSTRLPFPAGAPEHEEGAPVRILFRPETVQHQREPFSAPSVLPVGQGKVIERTFSGAHERVRFEIETFQGVRPLAPALAYGQRFVTLEASAPSLPIHGGAAVVGEQRWIGLTHYHVLEPTGLKVLVVVEGDDSRALFAANHLALASHGLATLMKVAKPGESLEAARSGLKNLLSNKIPRTEAKIDLRARQGMPSKELVQELQEGYHDLTFVDRPLHVDVKARKLSFLVRRALRYGAVPVVLVGKPVDKIERILVCTAAGEPGKTDVRFAARIARHTRAFTTVFHVLRADSSADETKRVERHLQHAAAMLDAFNVPNEIKLASQPLVPAILGQLEQGQYDLLVIGAPGSATKIDPRSADLVTQIVSQTEHAVAIVPMAD